MIDRCCDKVRFYSLQRSACMQAGHYGGMLKCCPSSHLDRLLVRVAAHKDLQLPVCMHAGLSVLDQAADFGYPSTVYMSQPRDTLPKMPSWAWLLVAVAALSIPMAGKPTTLIEALCTHERP